MYILYMIQTECNTYLKVAHNLAAQKVIINSLHMLSRFSLNRTVGTTPAGSNCRPSVASSLPAVSLHSNGSVKPSLSTAPALDFPFPNSPPPAVIFLHVKISLGAELGPARCLMCQVFHPNVICNAPPKQCGFFPTMYISFSRNGGSCIS